MTDDRYARLSINGVYDREGPIAADLALCHELGISWLAVPNWKFAQDGVGAAVDLLNADEVRVSTICHPNLLTLDDRGRWPRELDSARRTIDIAVDVGAASVYLTTGSRGSLAWPQAAAG